jgi:hypothetical protein
LGQLFPIRRCRPPVSLASGAAFDVADGQGIDGSVQLGGRKHDRLDGGREGRELPADQVELAL